MENTIHTSTKNSIRLFQMMNFLGLAFEELCERLSKTGAIKADFVCSEAIAGL